jgi:hypothetical protein
MNDPFDVGKRVRITRTMKATVQKADGNAVQDVFGLCGEISEWNVDEDIEMYYVRIDDTNSGDGSDYVWLAEWEVEPA